MYVNIFFSSFSVEFQHFLGYPIIKVNMYTFLDFFILNSQQSFCLQLCRHKSQAKCIVYVRNVIVTKCLIGVTTFDYKYDGYRREGIIQL